MRLLEELLVAVDTVYWGVVREVVLDFKLEP